MAQSLRVPPSKSKDSFVSIQNYDWVLREMSDLFERAADNVWNSAISVLKSYHFIVYSCISKNS